jgi:small subunit ribosomal protein S6
MLVLRPDAPDDRIQAVLERTTRAIVSSGGQILKAAPWGRRRLAYAIDRYREGSYHIVLFEAPPEAIVDLERSLLITEEVLRQLVTRVDRPIRLRGRDGAGEDVTDLPPVLPDEEDDEAMLGEQIDESESEAAPAATD